MNTKIVISSYLITGGSIGLIVLSFFVPGIAYSSYPSGFFPRTILLFSGVGGLVLGPYFALAGFIAKENSIWFEANRMIHQHISFPILGGLVLYLGLLSYLFFEILTVYLTIVLLVTLISVMANKTSKPAGYPQEPAKN